MEKISSFLNKRFYVREIQDEAKEMRMGLATELYEKFGKKVKYPAILKLINEKGVQYIRELAQELEKTGSLHWELLCWHASRVKIIWR